MNWKAKSGCFWKFVCTDCPVVQIIVCRWYWDILFATCIDSPFVCDKTSRELYDTVQYRKYEYMCLEIKSYTVLDESLYFRKNFAEENIFRSAGI